MRNKNAQLRRFLLPQRIILGCASIIDVVCQTLHVFFFHCRNSVSSHFFSFHSRESPFVPGGCVFFGREGPRFDTTNKIEMVCTFVYLVYHT